MFKSSGLLYCAVLLLMQLQPAGGETVSPAPSPASSMVRYSISGSFEEIKDYLVSAIEEQGIKISNTSYIARMLERTATEVGNTTKVYRHAQAMEFCNARLSHQLAANNPHHIIYCPYIIYIYELESQKGTIHLSYRKSSDADRQANPALVGIEALLEKIISAAME